MDRRIKIVIGKCNLRYTKIVVLVVIFILLMAALKAQNFKAEFNQYKQENAKGYNQFVEQIDDEFADFLRSNWQTFQVHSGTQIEEKPKPKEFPRSHKIIPEPVEMDFDQRVPELLNLSEELVMPVNHKTITLETSFKSAKFEFFGDSISIQYDPAVIIDVANHIAPDGIADYWEKVSQTDYRLTLDYLFFYKNKYALNDYGYYLLIKKFASSILNPNNQIRLFTWFALAKSKYKTRIGYNGKQVYLLLPSKQKIYKMNYFTHNKISFYVMDFKGGELYAYDGDYPGAYKTIDFSLSQPLQLKEKTASKQVQVYLKEKTYTFDFKYNENAIDLCRSIPQIELEGYFNAQPTKSTQQSLIDNLIPIIKDMDEYEAVSFLLQLVQNGFDYKIDEEQFGTEKVFFPEEILHYPFSDCEDRAVFFAYLVNALLGNEVIGLDYPAHVATAVRFKDDIPGDYFLFENKKYIVCDPTYINAPIGTSMRDLSNYSAEIIRKGNKDISLPALLNLKQELRINGDIDAPRVIEVKPGRIMAANYSKELFIQGRALNPSQNSVFLASFDQSNQLNWTKKIGGNDSYLKGIEIGQNGNLIVLDGGETIGSYQLTSLDSSGNVLWSTKIDKLKSHLENANVQVALFDHKGNQIAGKTYVETSFFNEKKLAIKEDKIIVMLAINNE